MIIVGFFDLDPNRVLDVLLDLMGETVHVYHVFWVKLLSSSLWAKAKEATSGQTFSSLLAALFGFKLQNYTNSASDGRVPQSLYLSIAVLIKNKLIVLDDLYSYLSPDEENGTDMFKVWLKTATKNARTTGANSILADSVLTADERPSSRGEKQKDDIKKSELPAKPKEPEHQRAELCLALFEAGAFEDGITMLKLDDKLIHFKTDIADWICRALHWIIEPYFVELRSSFLSKSLASALEGDMEVDDQPQSAPVQINCFPPDGCALPLEGQQNWSEGLTQCSTIEEVFDSVLPVLQILGGYLSHDISLATKMCRICQGHMSQTKDQMTRRIWSQIIVHVFFPTLSLTYGNPAFNNEVWSIIKNLPYQNRYTLYGEWKNHVYDSHPELIGPKMTAVFETKKIMRRVAKENVKQFGRQIGKLSHANPTLCFATILEQIQAYENLITVAVDCFKYTSDLGMDVLTYVLVQDLARPDKERLKSDGTNISLWLNSLAVFSGNLYKKHANLELLGLLNYLVCQLKDGNPFDLVIMKELVTGLSGLEQLTEGASEAQMEAMAGGPTLRRESVTLGPSKNLKRSSQRLAAALLESGLAKQCVVLLGKQRAACVFREDIEYLKLLGSLFDQIQETLLQFVEFVTTNISDEAYATRVIPSIDQLILSYGIEPDVAWYIARQRLRYLIKQEPSDHTDESIWVRQLEPVVENVNKLLPAGTWEMFDPHFYTTFWQLALYDLHVPADRYKEEVEKQNKMIASMEEEAKTNRETKREVDRIKGIVSELESEMKAQYENSEIVSARLKKESGHWFSSLARDDVLHNFIQFCIRPRCVFSAPDAVYCARLIFHMHSLGTKMFSTLGVIGRIIDDVELMVFACSQNEAMHYGRFLKEMLAVMHLWHKDASIYASEAIGDKLPGLLKHWPKETDSNDMTDADDTESWLGYEEYRHLMYKWHLSLCKSFLSCLESKDDTKIRNAIVILDKVTDFFPVVRTMGSQMERRVQRVLESESREDLKVLLTRYLAALRKIRPRWKRQEKFHLVAGGEQSSKSGDVTPMTQDSEVGEVGESGGQPEEGEYVEDAEMQYVPVTATADQDGEDTAKGKVEVKEEEDQKSESVVIDVPPASASTEEKESGDTINNKDESVKDETKKSKLKSQKQKQTRQTKEEADEASPEPGKQEERDVGKTVDQKETRADKKKDGKLASSTTEKQVRPEKKSNNKSTQPEKAEKVTDKKETGAATRGKSDEKRAELEKSRQSQQEPRGTRSSDKKNEPDSGRQPPTAELKKQDRSMPSPRTQRSSTDYRQDNDRRHDHRLPMDRRRDEPLQAPPPPREREDRQVELRRERDVYIPPRRNSDSVDQDRRSFNDQSELSGDSRDNNMRQRRGPPPPPSLSRQVDRYLPPRRATAPLPQRPPIPIREIQDRKREVQDGGPIHAGPRDDKRRRMNSPPRQVTVDQTRRVLGCSSFNSLLSMCMCRMCSREEESFVIMIDREKKS